MFGMKTDFLKECMSDVTSAIKRAVTIDDFNREFCAVCLTKECSRSGNNNLLIALRARNWENDLFTNPNRASQSDALVKAVAEKWKEPEVQIKIQNTMIANENLPPQLVQEPLPKEVEPAAEELLLEYMPQEAVTQTFGADPEPVQEEVAEQHPADTQQVHQHIDVEPEPVAAPAPVVEAPRPAPIQNAFAEQQLTNRPLNTPFNKPSYLGESKEEVVIESGGSFTFG